MTPSNRSIAIEYLDIEIEGCGVAALKKRVKKALKQDHAISTLEFNTLALEVDAKAQSVKLEQDWDACEPVIFAAEEFLGLVDSSRERRR